MGDSQGQLRERREGTRDGKDSEAWEHLRKDEVLVHASDETAALAAVQLLVHGTVVVHPDQLLGVQRGE